MMTPEQWDRAVEWSENAAAFLRGELPAPTRLADFEADEPDTHDEPLSDVECDGRAADEAWGRDR